MVSDYLFSTFTEYTIKKNIMNKPTIKEVEEWVMTLYNTCEETITDAERREQHKYATMVQRPQDK